MKHISISLVIFYFTLSILNGQDKSDWEGGFPDGCTSITLGKMATLDGSVITSHTDDSHRTRSWMDIQPAKTHKKGAKSIMYKRVACDSFAMPTYSHLPIGEIPQVKKTNQFLNTAYPCMNEHQVGIGESTFGGRAELQSDSGLIDCQRLCLLMLERASTAREAIKIAGELMEKYGWNDFGECLTISDPEEVWHLEIVGPGKGKTGAIWVAQRVPDDHVSVNVNANISDGFTFLGWTFRKFKGKLLIKPSKESQKSVIAKIRDVIQRGKAWDQGRLIRILNPIIKGWAQYHNHAVSSEVFSKLDHIVFNMLLAWAKRRHSNKGVWWTIMRYWHRVDTRKYVFTTGNETLEIFSDVKIVRHRLAKLDKNPFIDKEYFEKWKVSEYYRKKNTTYSKSVLS